MNAKLFQQAAQRNGLSFKIRKEGVQIGTVIVTTEPCKGLPGSTYVYRIGNRYETRAELAASAAVRAARKAKPEPLHPGTFGYPLKTPAKSPTKPVTASAPVTPT